MAKFNTKPRKAPPPRNLLLKELWTNGLFRSKLEKSEGQRADHRDPWSRKTKHRNKIDINTKDEERKS